ncbi:thermonuclease family protein [Candidatus Avelusimicrobium alvi]|uniref:thermonuclease family protein n=1 Tax=Candidatus Avelusimicrobium alvi TaxID=3416221 RepID=UPI003D0D5BE7
MIRLVIKIGCVFFIIGGLAIPQLSAAQNFYKVRLASVYDGDTFKVYLACRYPLFCKKMSVRVNGVDCPELKTKNPCEKKAAQRAKRFTEDFLKSGSIILRNCTKDKYFRLLCDVFVREPLDSTRKAEKSLSQALLGEQLAVLYNGGIKQKISWCK